MKQRNKTSDEDGVKLKIEFYRKPKGNKKKYELFSRLCDVVEEPQWILLMREVGAFQSVTLKRKLKFFRLCQVLLEFDPKEQYL